MLGEPADEGNGPPPVGACLDGTGRREASPGSSTTGPGSRWCPFAARVVDDVEAAIRRQPGVETCEVEIVWDEVWTTDRLSPSAARRLRFLPDPVAVPDRDAFVSAHRS